MNTRQVTQVELFALKLNSVYGRCEDVDIVAIAYSKGRLIQWMKEQELKEGFRDESGKFRSFKQGALYNYNPFRVSSRAGIDSEWINQDRMDIVRNNHLVLEG